MNVNLPSIFYVIAWSLWGLWFVVVEGLALLDPDPDDTLTELVRPILQSDALGYFLGGGFLLWLIWHFLVEPAR